MTLTTAKARSQAAHDAYSRLLRDLTDHCQAMPASQRIVWETKAQRLLDHLDDLVHLWARMAPGIE